MLQSVTSKCLPAYYLTSMEISIEFLIILGVAFLGATTQGFIGFGFGIICIGLFTQLLGFHHATVLVNLIGLFAPLVILIRLRKDIRWDIARLILPAGMLGLLLGVQSIVTFDPVILKRALGVTIVLFSIWSLLRGGAGKEIHKAWAHPSGFLSGLLSGAFNIGGPPLIAYIYRLPYTPKEIKATVQLIFLTISITRIPLLVYNGLVTEAVLVDTAWCLAPVALGTVVGIRLAEYLPAEKFRAVAWGGFGLMGAWLAMGS